ncbi:YiiX/YebB-like N1pC/P60 family cysteine hydrolase [Bacteriovorax sp. Seq25_V]|uniref:YiiX/YebB-like N1pC/P60 family cysteine hydrolase n=1 Tax=Bacteriovorax sp. Seq25_V TaxID=1201288 RepID=UPI00038A3613|nr:YiiX/YebB-like N1pC/P60 family cysteine hydrolase [Bacteriovorax sp. Seq25_V]EQC47671.1 orthopoxovirus protein, PF05708 domain protein [Bacteriovorax sp. Seq25_V]
MLSKKIKFFIAIFVSLISLASGVHELDYKLNNAYVSYYKSIYHFINLANSSEKFYFEDYQRDEILKITSRFITELDQAVPDHEDLGRDRNIYSKKNKSFVLNKIIYFKWLSRFIETSMSGGNALVAVVGEDSKRFKKLVKAVLRQGSQVRNPSRNHDSRFKNNLRIIDMYNDVDKLIKTHKLKSFEAELVAQSLSELIESLSSIREISKDINYKVGSYSILYHLKVFLLKAASFIALPGEHKISSNTLNQIDEELLPGDIGVIQRYNKLSNIVFKGNWTHSLMYLGRFSKFQNYFDNDIKTRVFYFQRCISEDLQCNDYISYLELKFPDAMKKFIDGEYLKDPIMTIESLKPGVILFNQKKSMGWDNLALFRPRLSTLDKARAIEAAFSKLGAPYDYNFNGQTNDRLVCTELISYSYQSDPRIFKQGISWEMNFVMNHPVMYAFDIVETYFKRKGKSNQELDLVIYVKGEKGEFGKARRGSEAELLKTVDLKD